ncbi:MAG: HEAT repeat domain-containing protein [Deltaproteobacteria bacterium]|nr:HEAT repeat domain-containing protein [Deltaproteobacteria bacterium]
MTDRNNLAFLYRAVAGTNAALPPPEQAAATLGELIMEQQGSTPSGLMRWLQRPQTLNLRSLIALIRLAGLTGDEQLAEPLTIILRQLAYVAAHPAAVRALSEAKGITASKALEDMLWAMPMQQWHVREPAIIKELGRLGRTSSIPALIKALGVPFDAPAHAASVALSKYPPEGLIERLVPLLKADDKGTADARAAGAAEALGLLSDPRAITALQRSAGSADPRVAINSAVALARLGTPDAEERLVQLTSHRSVNVRASALSALALLGERDDASALRCQTLMEHGLSDTQPEVRTAAASALGGLGRPAGAAKIARAMSTEVSPLVRTQMIRALGRLAHPFSVDALVAALNEGDSNTKIEVLGALAMFGNPEIARIISPHRASPDRRVVKAASLALTKLLVKVFKWPDPAPIDSKVQIRLYSQEGARERLLPPPPPPPQPGFFNRLFGAQPPEPPQPPKPVGILTLTPEYVEVRMNPNPSAPSDVRGRVNWDRRFGAHITREAIEQGAGSNDNIGIHFALRQRKGTSGAVFESVGVSLWCAPSADLGRLPAKSERFPCLDPHKADPFLASLRWFSQLHGETIQGLR